MPGYVSVTERQNIKMPTSLAVALVSHVEALPVFSLRP